MTECNDSKSQSKRKAQDDSGRSRRRRWRGKRTKPSNSSSQDSSSQGTQRKPVTKSRQEKKTYHEKSNRSGSQRNSKRRQKRSGRQRHFSKASFTTKLSENFSKEDFWVKDDEGKHRLKISLGLVGALELLQFKLGRSITIVQGYVTPEQAERSGNWKRNFHLLGLAADIRVKELSLEALFLVAETIEVFKGIGLDIIGNHVHVDMRHQDERVLWVVQDGEELELTDALRQQVFEDVAMPDLILDIDGNGTSK